MEKFLLGWALASTIIALFSIWMLFKKQSTTNEIDTLKQKNKRNKNSTIDNDINANIGDKDNKRKKRIKLFNKNKEL